MSFNGTEGGAIDHNVAADYTAAFRDRFPNARKGAFFGRDILEQILAQDGCMGIRVYYGINNKKPEPIFVGADEAENDILVSAGATAIVADLSVPCPPSCGVNNILNS
jgi:hypothetical protein